jgi:basic membrane protein A and related proteins
MFWFAAVVFATASIAAGCGDDDDDSGDGGSGGASTEETTNVGLAMIGPKNDKGFSQDHYEGVIAATEELPVKLNGTVENSADAQKRLDAFRNLAPNNDLVIGASVTFVDTATTVAPEFPDTDFIINSPPAPKKIDNLTSLVLEEGQPSVLAGVTMATLTKTKKIGVIAGAEVPASEHKIEGVKVGAGEVDPEVRVADTLTGDYNDVAKAKDAAAALIANDVDQILGDLDVGIQGVYEAVKESGKDVGVYQVIDLDCKEDNSVVGAVIYDNGALMQEAITEYKDGSLKPGAIFFSMKTSEILRFELCPKYEKNKKLVQKLEETEAAILDGSLELPRGAVLNELPAYKIQER